MAQTSVEWIFQEEEKAFKLLELGEISLAQYRLKIISIEKIAKQLEEEQIEEAREQGYKNGYYEAENL